MPIDPNKVGNDTAADFMRKMKANNVPKDEAFAYFRENFGLDPSEVDADVPLKTLLGRAGTPITRGETTRANPNELLMAGGRAAEDLVDTLAKPHTPPLSWDLAERLPALGRGAVRSAYPSKEEGQRIIQAEEDERLDMVPGETDAQGNRIDMQEGDPSTSNTVAALKGLAKGVTVVPAVLNPPQGTPDSDDASKLTQADIEKRYEENALGVNLLSDIRDVVVAPFKTALDVLGPTYLPEGVSEAQYGEHLGRGLGAGAIGGTAGLAKSFLEHPIKTLDARPATTAVSFLPLARGFKNAAKGVIIKTMPKAELGARVSAVFEKASQAVPENIRQPIVDGYTRIQQVLADGLAQSDPETMAMVEDLVVNPEKAVSELTSIAERVAAKTQGGKVQRVRAALNPGDQLAPGVGRDKVVYATGAEGPSMEVARFTPDQMETNQAAIRRAHQEATINASPELSRDINRAVRLVADLRKVDPADAEAMSQIRGIVQDRFLGSVTDAASPSLLVSPAVRRAVVNQVAARLGRKDKATLRYIDQALRKAAEEGSLPVFGDFDSRGVGPVDVRSILARTTVRPQDRAFALQEAVASLAADESHRAVANGLKAEMARVAGGLDPREDGPASPEAMLTETRVRVGAAAAGVTEGATATTPSGGKATVTPRGVEVAQNDQAMASQRIAGRIAQNLASNAKGEAPHQAPPIALPQWAEPKIVASTLEMYASKTKNAAVGKQMRAAAHDIRNMRPLNAKVLGVEGWAEPLVASAMEWHIRAQKSLFADTWFGAVQSYAKRNLVARSISSILNNTISNIGAQTLRRGDPTIGARMIAEGARWEAWKAGRATVDPKVAQMYRAFESVKLLDTDALSADIGISKGIALPNKILEYGFKAGDQLGKLEEGAHNYGKVTGYLDDLTEGQSITAPISTGQKIRVTRKGDGFEARNLNTKKVMTLAAGSDELARVKASISAVPAEGIMFDYSRTPRLAQMMKVAPIIGIASPFMTWAWKALDIPGSKKGLGYRTLLGAPLEVSSNSPRVLARLAADDLMLSARKSMVVQSARQDLIRSNQDELAKLTWYMPGETRMGMVRVLSDPNYVGTFHFGAWNFLGPTEKLLKLMVLAGAPDSEDIPDLYPRMADGSVDYDLADLPPAERGKKMRARKLLRAAEMGELGSTGDVLDLISLSGSPLMEFVERSQDAKRAGVDMGWGDAYKIAGGAVLGGTYQRLADIGLSYMQEQEGVRIDQIPVLGEALAGAMTRPATYSVDPNESEPFARWWVRRLTGLGWRVRSQSEFVSPKEMGSFLAKAKLEWHASVKDKERIKQAQAELAEATRVGDTARASWAKERIQRYRVIGSVIDSEINRMAQGHFEMVRALGGSPQAMEPPADVATDE